MREKVRGGGSVGKTGRVLRMAPAARVLKLARVERDRMAGRVDKIQRAFEANPWKKRLDSAKSELAEWDRILRALGSIDANIPAEAAPVSSRKCANCGRPAWARSDLCLSCSTDKSRLPGKHAQFGRCKCGRARSATQDVCDICAQMEKKKTA